MLDEKLTQETRLLSLQTELGGSDDETLIVERFSATEQMSEGFTYVLNLCSNRHDINNNSLVGTPTTVSLIQSDAQLRYFNGYVQSMECLGMDRVGQRSHYRMTVSSWLEVMLSKRSDCRIFQNNSADSVIDLIFSSYGRVANYQLDLKSKPPNRRYWVQYNETDLEFFNRICHREGLAYYFSHDNGAHTLHIIDDAEKLLLPKQVIPIQGDTHANDHLFRWQSAGHFTTGHYTQRTYNYMQPSEKLEVDSEISGDIKQAANVKSIKSYRFSDAYQVASEGKTDITYRAKQGSERTQIRSGTGNCRYLLVGQRVRPTHSGSGDFADSDKEFNLTSVHLVVDAVNGAVNCSIEALPGDELIYPYSVTPVINGLQTAVVTGPEGKQLHSDELGRIKVQFHWDRHGKKDHNTTCWLRVMQSFAGANFGAHFTPRIGQEVVVAFENGNPDRPFVIGALYHPEHTPPYGDQKGTRSGIRTHSIDARSSNKFNELYFDDTNGNEEVYLQAEKNLNTRVKHDEDHKVQNDQFIAITHDKHEKVGSNSTLQVGKQLTIEAGQSITLKVGGSEITMSGSSISIKSNLVEIDGSQVKIN